MDGKAAKGAADGHRGGRAESDGRVRMLRSLARRRQKMHGVWKFNNITPSHPSHAVDTFCVYQRRTCDGKAAKGAVDGQSTRKDRGESVSAESV
jgi:hypothetical protein